MRILKTWLVTNHRLYYLMIEKGYTTETLAKCLRVSPRTVQRWLYENTTPNIKNMDDLCQLLCVQPEDILPKKY